MNFISEVAKVQKNLQKEHVDGWLIYDYKRSNPLACEFLKIPQEELLTRRFFYWIGKNGSIKKIVHRIENPLSHLPGETFLYSSWQELNFCLSDVLLQAKSVAMEYSSDASIPEISKVDGGTLDLVRKFGVNVVSSAGLLQEFIGVWDDYKLQSHYFAASTLENIFEKTWCFIQKRIKQKKPITEYDVQQFVIAAYESAGCITECLPICAVNNNSANPHYIPNRENAAEIKKGDVILLDLGCKKNAKRSVYADLTKMALVAKKPTEQQAKVFSIVKSARDKTLNFIKEKYGKGEVLRGCDVDDYCRDIIKQAGFGDCFVHRTGHSIDEKEHGPGTHLDNLETHDWRKLIPHTCCSIEPGIYLPSQFGIRLECNVVFHTSGQIEVTGGLQNEWHYLLA
ncbi:MAG: M24 family metallopeptidase [Parachlamydiaceae bacterium]